ncbi:MAG TPA: hypothetical protein VFH51_10440 [Myxococcota bacterium]|nr:hypothetical protein [Myxococcota bacterium]
MGEVVLAVGLFLLLASMSLAVRYVAWFALLRAGVWLVVVGSALSLSGGLIYHVALYRVLGSRGELAPRWWLWPTSLHGRLLAQERPLVLPWFFLGAAGFGVVMLGCAAVLLAVWRGD